MKLWEKQEEILWAVRNNKRVCVKSGNTVGKSYIAADIVMDFLICNYPSKVVTTAPSWPQVEDILWKEIATHYNKSKIPIGGRLLKTELIFNDEWFAVGISTDQPVRFQGRHSPHLLVLIDEASGMNPDIWDMIEALHPEKIVAIGNPLENSGKFYEIFSSALWHKVTINCRDCIKWQNNNVVIPGLVTQQWINDMEDIHGRNSPYVKIHVDGEFPEEASDALISRSWVERARLGLDIDGKSLEEEREEDVVRLVSCDVATKHGENETVIGYSYGHTIKEMQGYYRVSIDKSADNLVWKYSQKRATSVTIDSDGVGEGLADILIRKHIPVLEFHGGYGQKAVDQTKFKNLRTQFYWMVAKKFEKGMYNLKQIPEREYQILKNQLCSIRTKAPDALGRIQIETKEDMMARQVKSPDYADTFVLLEYGRWAAKYTLIDEIKWR